MVDDELAGLLSAPTSVHIIGIGGAGMSAFALVLRQMGHSVSGSDLRESPVLDRLRRSGVEVAVGHDATNVKHAAVVTASPAVAESNVELLEARRAGSVVVGRAQMMAAIASQRQTLAVAGTHGKTTTSSMLSLILVAAGVSPSFLLGADVTGVGANALWGEGDLLVIEADESYGSFAQLQPAITALTNIEADHLDHYGTVNDLEAAFEGLLRRSTRATIVMADDAGAARVGAAVGALRVGVGPDVDVAIAGIETSRASSSFTMTWPDEPPLSLRVGAPGLHNVRNAAMAAATAHAAGIERAAIVEGLARFAGVPRRYEFRGEADGIVFVDDYAHLPAEVAATLAAAAEGGFDRIVAVFQPHRFTRTSAVATGFAESFGVADEVVITGIYSAGETPIPGVQGTLVANAVRSVLGLERVHYVEERDLVVDLVDSLLTPGDLCLTMGAGDLTTLPDELLGRRR